METMFFWLGVWLLEKGLVELIMVVAPSVAREVVEAFGKWKVRRGDLNLVLVALIMEQNHRVLESLEVTNKSMLELLDRIKDMTDDLRSVGEGVAVLLKRTE